jgi:hypothetical protein
LLLRINRALNNEGRGRRILAARGGQHEQLGRFYLVGAHRVLTVALDLEQFAGELGVIESWEAL